MSAGLVHVPQWCVNLVCQPPLVFIPSPLFRRLRCRLPPWRRYLPCALATRHQAWVQSHLLLPTAMDVERSVRGQARYPALVVSSIPFRWLALPTYLPACVPLPVWSAFGSGELDCRYIKALKARTPPLYWILISIFSRRRLCLHHNSQADKNQACSLLLLPPSYCHSWLESPGPTPTVRAMRGQ